MAELYNKKINAVDRLIALHKIIESQKRSIIDCEIKVDTFIRQINHIQLKGGGGDLIFLEQQKDQFKMLFEGTSAALEIAREQLFDLHDKYHSSDHLFAEKWKEIYGTPEKDILA